MFRKIALCAAAMSVAAFPAMAGDQADIQLIINQSPWYGGFEKTVEQYEAETGNKVNIEAVPFPVLLEKSRNSVRASEGLYDLLTINAIGIMEMYAGGFLASVNSIDPDYELRDDVSDFGGSVYWNHETGSIGKGGELMALPMAGVIQLLYYREDLYKELNLEVPKTWDQLYDNAKAIQDAGDTRGYVVRGSRQNVGYNAMSYIYSHGGSVYADAAGGDYSVTINSPESLAGFKTFLKFAEDLAPQKSRLGRSGGDDPISGHGPGRPRGRGECGLGWAGESEQVDRRG